MQLVFAFFSLWHEGLITLQRSEKNFDRTWIQPLWEYVTPLPVVFETHLWRTINILAASWVKICLDFCQILRCYCLMSVKACVSFGELFFSIDLEVVISLFCCSLTLLWTWTAVPLVISWFDESQNGHFLSERFLRDLSHWTYCKFMTEIIQGIYIDVHRCWRSLFLSLCCKDALMTYTAVECFKMVQMLYIWRPWCTFVHV